MRRRDFLEGMLGVAIGIPLFGLSGCGTERSRGGGTATLFAVESERGTVTLYDTHAMALYMDGGLGPKTGIVKVEYVLQNQPVPMKFWHGHGGKDHQFTLLPEHFSELKRLKRVTLETTVVAGHKHKLFIDPVDPKYRVAGAKPVEVPVEG